MGWRLLKSGLIISLTHSNLYLWVGGHLLVCVRVCMCEGEREREIERERACMYIDVQAVLCSYSCAAHDCGQDWKALQVLEGHSTYIDWIFRMQTFCEGWTPFHSHCVFCYKCDNTLLLAGHITVFFFGENSPEMFFAAFTPCFFISVTQSGPVRKMASNTLKRVTASVVVVVVVVVSRCSNYVEEAQRVVLNHTDTSASADTWHIPYWCYVGPLLQPSLLLGLGRFAVCLICWWHYFPTVRTVLHCSLGL